MAARSTKPKSAAKKAAARKRSSKSDSKAKAYREFVSEAEEILDRMREDLADMHEQRAGGGEVDPDLVNRIFRSAHSLKGLAGMFGLDALSELAHHMEDILDGLRLGRVNLQSSAPEVLEEAVALFSILLGQGDDVDPEEQAGLIADMIHRIEDSVSQPPTRADDLDGLDLDPSLLRALTEYEEHRLRENIRRERHISLVDSTFEIIAFEEGLSELTGAIREVGEVISTLPSPGDAPESQIRFSLLVATDIPTPQLEERLEFSNTSVRLLHAGVDDGDESARVDVGAASVEPTPAAGETGSDETGAVVVAPSVVSTDSDAPVTLTAEPAPHTSGENPEIESLKSISDTVRVDIRKLDELMNLVGELVIQRNAIAGIAARLATDSNTVRIASELTKSHKMLDRKLKELQAGVLDVRMVPLRQIFEKLSRVVRRLRRDHEKDIQLDFRGADTELDKLIVEQLIDPLMHVVRNAFDHAIESPEERIAAGKPPGGTIRIHAFQRGNHVVIEVSDDGRGMDPQRILARAVERGLVAPGETLTNKEVIDLVFEPGFSTREEVSETSGRGVGMDVVRSNMAELGGMVDLSSVVGRGSTVTITLPITLAIIQALIVGVAEERFAIPLNSVLETLLVEADEIQRSEGREMLNLRGEPLLLRRMSEEFDLHDAVRHDRYYVVVLGLGEQRLGLLVDTLYGQQDTVIKPIKGPIQQIRGIAGATELGDEGAILVIDVSVIVGEAIRRREAA